MTLRAWRRTMIELWCFQVERFWSTSWSNWVTRSDNEFVENKWLKWLLSNLCCFSWEAQRRLSGPTNFAIDLIYFFVNLPADSLLRTVLDDSVLEMKTWVPPNKLVLKQFPYLLPHSCHIYIYIYIHIYVKKERELITWVSDVVQNHKSLCHCWWQSWTEWFLRWSEILCYQLGGLIWPWSLNYSFAGVFAKLTKVLRLSKELHDKSSSYLGNQELEALNSSFITLLYVCMYVYI